MRSSVFVFLYVFVGSNLTCLYISDEDLFEDLVETRRMVVKIKVG